MKLENDNNSYGKFNFCLFVSAIIAGLVVILYLFIKIIINGELEESIFLIFTVFFAVLVIIIASYIYYDIMVGSMNIKRKYIKDVGEKVKAQIVNAGVLRGRGHVNYYIIVSYRGKCKDVYYLKNNEAYEILKLLLNPFPVKHEVSIPIDIYVYKNKIYADLESVELSKIEGYEDAKKAVDESYGDVD